MWCILSVTLVLGMVPMISPQENGGTVNQLSSFDFTYRLFMKVASIENKNAEMEKKLAGLENMNEELSSTVRDQQTLYDEGTREMKKKMLDLETTIYEMQSQLNQLQCPKEKVYGKIEEFNLDDNWDDYEERLEQYFIANDIDDAGKRDCKPGYTWYSSGARCYCFKFYFVCKTWWQAQTQCRAEGGDLLMLKTSPELTDFVRMLKHEYASGVSSCGYWQAVWVGATDSSKEGTWKWADGTTASLIGLWAPGDPNDGGRNGSEDCVFLSPRSNWKYLDADCSRDGHRSAFVCAV